MDEHTWASFESWQHDFLHDIDSAVPRDYPDLIFEFKVHTASD